MGEVWAAEHQMLARPVAVKLIRPEMLGSDRETSSVALRRFEKEAQATARLRSPQTVEIHDFGAREDGTFYYVMELLEGISLADLVEKFGPLRADRAVYLLRQTCESLAEAHNMGLIHRDIKPTNIFACRFGLRYDFIKVLDFGLVKLAGSAADTRLTRAGLVVGTPAFIAPELATNAAGADARSDIYSLGCVAYWLVTGKLVFESETPVGMILEHVQTTPIPPSKRSEVSLPSRFQDVILSCLEKEPGRRPQSALALIEALDSCGPFGWDQRVAREWWDKHKPSNLTGEGKQ
jgi:serine/threonine-protein kinase